MKKWRQSKEAIIVIAGNVFTLYFVVAMILKTDNSTVENALVLVTMMYNLAVWLKVMVDFDDYS